MLLVTLLSEELIDNFIFQITSVASQQKVMHANVKLSDAMGATAKTMGNMNKIMNPAQVAQTMQEFEKASTKLDMSEEVSKYHINFFKFCSENGKNYVVDYFIY